MKLAKNIEALDRRVKCEQLVEECGELIKACMKLVRAENKENPCTIPVDTAVDDLIEEISDVEVAIDALIQDIEHSIAVRPNYDIYDRISEIAEEKIKRWNQRIENGCATTKTDTWTVSENGEINEVEK